MSVLLIGYDVEAPDAAVTAAFLKRASELHRELGAPATFFILGRILEASPDDLKPLAKDPLFDLEQHTYSHVLLKTVCMEKDGKVEVFRGGSLEQIRSEVSRTNRLLRDRLGLACLGLTGPFGYYRGLSDRPDVLEILHSEGIRFTRTYGRNEKDYQPLSFAAQPFWYEPQGFPDILEIPFQGWQDVYLRDRYGWSNQREYIDHLLKDCDEAARLDAVWSYCTHDWSAMRADEDLRYIRELIDRARLRGMEIMTHAAYYQSRAADSAVTPTAT